MVETVYKLIPSKGTRLRIMVVLEFIAIVWAFYASSQAISSADLIAVFIAWADFTKWNVGIYAASETIVKGAESGMNR